MRLRESRAHHLWFVNKRRMHAMVVRDFGEKGRGVVASRTIVDGEMLFQCMPMASVLKEEGQCDSLCVQCFSPIVGGGVSGRTQYCSNACASHHEARGGLMLSRADLAPLHQLHAEQGRKFPLHIAQLLAGLLHELKATGRVPEAWPPLELCYAELEDEAEVDSQVASEHLALLDAFDAAGLASRSTLELFLPEARYRRLLGAAQLNAFELRLSHGAVVSALLPGIASCFNHSCEPTVLISCGESTGVSFVANTVGVGAGASGGTIAEGHELCISYIDLDAPAPERQHTLLHKYGFRCDCARCRRGE